MAMGSWNMAFKKISFRHSLLLLLLSLLFLICASIDTITPVQSLHEGHTLVSAAGNYEFGFFTPGNSSSRYLGIWYKRASSEKKYVWVANRESPLSNISRLVVSIANDGNLEVSIPGRMPVFRITNASAAESQTTATLLDSGNLVLRDGRGNWLWQSFDFPTNTLLPLMKLGLDRRTGRARTITSWKSENDPGIGDYEVRLGTDWSPQLLLYKGSQLLWRSGPWNGLGFSGIPLMNHQSVVTYHIMNDSEGIYYSYDLNNNSVLSRLLVESSGQVQRLTWVEGTTKWKLFWEAPTDRCDTYALCGAFSICEVSRVQMCECLQGFRPRQPQEWSMRDWAAGCVRREELGCGKGDGFRKMENVKLPDGKAARQVRGLSSLRECRDECIKNCSCSGYACADIDKWAGNCLIWEGELTDLKQYTDGAMDLYVRSAASEIDSSWKRKKLVLILIFTIILPILLVLYCVYSLWKRDCIEKGSVAGTGSESERRREKSGLLDESGKSSETPLFDLSDVMLATNFFSDSNKLGEGGFGPVYKGELKNGKHIAVKRLASNSGQGTVEFKNEVTLIQQLQHRNLVRILGCCIEGEEKMLIYEYMENKSLDFLLFDKQRQALLDWPKRFNIIIGIARGVLYLHHDSRLTIIHRDLKASNVLLDEEMNPRISDFGMARIFGGNQTQANTNRVVGTYGYMSPEYAIHGLFSVKSDVFSFGVLLLEIVSGKRNSSYYRHDGTLIGHAWELWKEGRSLELVDSTIADSCSTSEVKRCVHVSLLCVQEHPINRPTMLSVVSMLSNETTMPPPKKPAYSSKKNFSDPDSSANLVETRSTNDLTITELAAR